MSFQLEGKKKKTRALLFAERNECLCSARLVCPLLKIMVVFCFLVPLTRSVEKADWAAEVEYFSPRIGCYNYLGLYSRKVQIWNRIDPFSFQLLLPSCENLQCIILNILFASGASSSHQDYTANCSSYWKGRGKCLFWRKEGSLVYVESKYMCRIILTIPCFVFVLVPYWQLRLSLSHMPRPCDCADRCCFSPDRHPFVADLPSSCMPVNSLSFEHLGRNLAANIWQDKQRKTNQASLPIRK